ncbi:TasA family protein [Halarchaeum sp. P4]|uniref:TasA family protein n=1 Tax=Halarchaeum sp. P4 TaxID=3421639 RepID=UPI003EB8F39B
MSDDKINLSRRKVLGGLATLGAAGAASGAGTFALFSDSETSSNNTIQAGTLDLTESTSFTAPAGGLAPGQSTSGSVTLTNGGSVSADHLEIGIASIANADGDTTSPDGEGSADKSASDVADHLYVDELAYGSGALMAMLPTVQIPGAYTYDFGGGSDITFETVSASDAPNSDSAPSGDILHVASDGDTGKYAHSMVDVSSQELTLNDLNTGTFKYDYFATEANTVKAPDEVKIVVEDTDGSVHFLYQHRGDEADMTSTEWKTRDVSSDLNKGGRASNANSWGEVDMTTGSTSSLGDSPIPEYGDATVLLVGVGAANTNGSVDVQADLYYGNLQVGSQTHSFPSTPATVSNLSNTVVDSLAAPGSGTDFSFSFRLDPDVGNDFQGEGADITFDFGLAQESGQNVL